MKTSVDIFLPESSILGTGFGIQERIHATIQVTSPAGVEIPCDGNDRHVRSILGAQPSSIATAISHYDKSGLPCGDDDDCFGVLFHTRADGGTADGLGRGGWPGSKETNFVEQVGIEDGLFCQEGCLCHETD